MNHISWHMAPISPQLNQDIHVWRAPLVVSPLLLDQLSEFLSSDEKSRGNRFINPKHRARYFVSHAILRDILSRYLQMPPGELGFIHSQHGKPYLLNLSNEYPVCFNMSHSHNMALFAVSLNKELGVDIEYIKKSIGGEKLAERFFMPSEYQQLMSLPAAQRDIGFYRCWTLKEAYLKVIGKGLSYSLKNFEVNLLAKGWNCLLSVRGSQVAAKRWQLGAFMIDSDYIGSLAVEGKFDRLSFWNWEAEAL